MQSKEALNDFITVCKELLDTLNAIAILNMNFEDSPREPILELESESVIKFKKALSRAANQFESEIDSNDSARIIVDASKSKLILNEQNITTLMKAAIFLQR